MQLFYFILFFYITKTNKIRKEQKTRNNARKGNSLAFQIQLLQFILNFWHVNRITLLKKSVEVVILISRRGNLLHYIITWLEFNTELEGSVESNGLVS